MKEPIKKFYEFLAQPLYPAARVALALLVIPLVFSFFQPLWRISMEAPQYPKGLYMDIYTYKLEGGNEGHDIKEINNLNHYIGMREIDRTAMADLDWIPFALGFLIIFTLRVAAIGTVRDLVDGAVLTFYVASFAFARFVYMLYTFGHDLKPDAPIKIPPFTPVIVGSKDIANFTTHSYPRIATGLIGVFVTGVIVILLWHLIAGRRRAAAAERAALKQQERVGTPVNA